MSEPKLFDFSAPHPSCEFTSIKLNQVKDDVDDDFKNYLNEKNFSNISWSNDNILIYVKYTMVCEHEKLRDVCFSLLQFILLQRQQQENMKELAKILLDCFHFSWQAETTHCFRCLFGFVGWMMEEDVDIYKQFLGQARSSKRKYIWFVLFCPYFVVFVHFVLNLSFINKT